MNGPAPSAAHDAGGRAGVPLPPGEGLLLTPAAAGACGERRPTSHAAERGERAALHTSFIL